MDSPIVYYLSDVSRLRDGAKEFLSIVSEDFGKGKVGIKVHFGEDGNITHVKAEWLKDAPSFFSEPVFVECNVLYRGSRTIKENHLKVARKHGFDFIPIDILDGDTGGDSVSVPIKKGTLTSAKLGAGIIKYDKLIAVSHFKGHMATGFGGALKNIGMGLGCRAGKLEMHSIVSPHVKSEACIACGKCVEDCPADAIKIKYSPLESGVCLTDLAGIDGHSSVTSISQYSAKSVINGKANIDPKKCIGCVHCIAICPQAAINIPWEKGGPVGKLMERIADYACASMDGRRWWFMNFITDVTYDCDCFGIKQTPFMKDAGILLSRDPVATDQASLDLVKEKNKGADPFLKKHKVDGSYMLEYAEKNGLGKRTYELKELSL